VTDHDAEFAPRARRTQAEAREETRHRLLSAAARVFAQKGFAGASLEEIAELAGYTTGALYYHFPNKEQLFLELLSGGWSRQNAHWAEAVTRVLDNVDADPFEALGRLVVERAERDNALEPLQGEFWLYVLRNPDGMAIFAERLAEQVGGLEPAIANLMDRCATPAGIEIDEMATVALALFQGLVRRRRIDPTAIPDDLFARVLRRLFLPDEGRAG
jgi:AcrR family transcriptional regulator